MATAERLPERTSQRRHSRRPLTAAARRCNTAGRRRNRLASQRPPTFHPMAEPISPSVVTSSANKDLPGYVSNGLIGLRVVDIPIRGGMSILNGFAGLHPSLRMEAEAPTPYPVAGDICVDGLWLSLSPQQAEFVDQRYDFSTGELTTRFTFRADGATVEAEVLTFCSRKQPTLVLQELSVRVSRPSDLVLRAKVDPDGIPGAMEENNPHPPGRDEEAADGSMRWVSFGDKSSCGIAYVTEFLGDEDAVPISPDRGRDRAQSPHDPLP